MFELRSGLLKQLSHHIIHFPQVFGEVGGDDIGLVDLPGEVFQDAAHDAPLGGTRGGLGVFNPIQRRGPLRESPLILVEHLDGGLADGQGIGTFHQVNLIARHGQPTDEEPGQQAALPGWLPGCQTRGHR